MSARSAVLASVLLAGSAAAQPATRLAAQDTRVRDFFGFAVALAGDDAFVGATEDTIGDAGPGRVETYRRDAASGAWVRGVPLSASDEKAGDLFGTSVSLSGDRLVVGAPGHDESPGDGYASGAAYVFERRDGVWTETAKLLPADIASPLAGLLFGAAVALDGDRLISTAIYDSDRGLFAGAAYAFARDPGTGRWTQTAKLFGPDTQGEDWLGTRVVLRGDVAVVSSIRANDIRGAAYVFRDTPGVGWRAEARLGASLPEDDDAFGISLALSDSLIAVGSSKSRSGAAFAGSVYVFRRTTSGGWAQARRLEPSDAGFGRGFGTALALDAGRLIIGAAPYFGTAALRGRVYRFDPDGAGGWAEGARIDDPFPGPYTGFGVRLVYDASTARLLVGAPYEGPGTTPFGGDNFGAAYIYDSPFSVASADPAPGASGLRLQVGPNPATRAATAWIEGLPGGATVDVYDAIGRRVATAFEGALGDRRQISLPVERLVPGVYTVRLTTGTAFRTARLVVTR